ncbi:MAG: ribonuclease P [Candidatus Aenigmarchaeota archaeon]|nr:ribonuclease P [Candidatus Aenigmarchaeota archaeon]
MRRNRGKKPEHQIRIAKERILILFDEAAKMVKEDSALANRYVALARKIGMRYNVRLPTNLKRKVCKYCKAFLQPGVTSSVRLKNGCVRVKCFNCNKMIFYPLRQRDK